MNQIRYNMSKSNELRKLYEKIVLTSTAERQLLSKVKNGEASDQEINDLLEIVQADENGAKILDEIKSFENALVTDMNECLNTLEEMANEDIDVAHCEDESEKNRRYTHMEKRYKKHVAMAEEILEAIKIAYFQVNNYDTYEDRLYKAKETLSHFE